jgi:hypothetical protein
MKEQIENPLARKMLSFTSHSVGYQHCQSQLPDGQDLVNDYLNACMQMKNGRSNNLVHHIIV